MDERKALPGKFVWFELVGGDAGKAQAFYGEVLGWKLRAFPVGDRSFDILYAGDTMLGGYAPPSKRAERSRWLSYVSVEDVDAAVAEAVAAGGKVLEAASDIPGVGRRARIADPQAAELGLLHSRMGDQADGPAPFGAWCWNELHTPDPASALAFYAKVVGFDHVGREMGPSGTYHVVSRGGVDRGGVTHHMPGECPEGEIPPPPHWLPYVHVEDVDATLARAVKLGGRTEVAAMDIPGVGRLGVLSDPTGASLAVLKPLPRRA